MPTPSPSPPPVHLTEPATADAIFRALNKAGFTVVASTAGSGAGGREPVKRINATFEDWPLVVSEYSSAKALAKAKPWKSGMKPGPGEPPIAFIGLNILIEWGPTRGGRPKKLEGRSLVSVGSLVQVIDPLLSPLKARTIVPVTMPKASTGGTSAMTSETPTP